MNTITQKLVQHFGTKTATYRHFKITKQAFSKWEKTYVPPKHAYSIEQLMAGSITASEICKAAEIFKQQTATA